MAGQSDLLSAAQNIATAINDAASTYLRVQGLKNFPTISIATLVKSGQGRLATVIVTTAGAAGKIYDANAATATTGLIYIIPAAIGVYVVNFPVGLGIVVAPGAAQVVSVSYS